MAEKHWKKATGDFPVTVNWEDTKVVEGKLISKKTVTAQGEPRNICRIETDDGEVTVWESAGLRSLFSLEEGTHVRISYKGKQNNPKTGRTFKAFDVEYVDSEQDMSEVPEPF